MLSTTPAIVGNNDTDDNISPVSQSCEYLHEFLYKFKMAPIGYSGARAIGYSGARAIGYSGARGKLFEEKT